MRWLLTIVVGFVISGCANQQPAYQQRAYQVGTPVISPLKIGGKAVPLPDGDWRVAASQRSYETPAIEMVSLYLINVRPKAEILGIQASTNLAPHPWGWIPLPECSRKDILFTHPNDSYSGQRQACWYVNHIIMGSNTRSSGAYLAALEFAHAKGIALPNVSPSVGFRIADRTDYLTVRYYFDPRAAGVPDAEGQGWIANAWHKDRVSQYPERRSYADKVIAWGREWFPKMQDGFYGRATQ